MPNKGLISRTCDEFWQLNNKMIHQKCLNMLTYIYERRYMNGWCKMLHRKMLKNIIHCCCVQSLSLWDSMDCSTRGFPVLHHPLEFIQTYIHWINDVTQPSHSLSSPSPPAFNLSQHQGLIRSLIFHQGLKTLNPLGLLTH